MIHGFVEELVVSDDPEYKWIDKIRTPRASNEARQILFFKLSGEVQRKIGLKALDLGGNAVIGYIYYIHFFKAIYLYRFCNNKLDLFV